MNKITKNGQCGKCKSDCFFLLETIGHRGWVDAESKEMLLKQRSNEIDSIECEGCQTVYTEKDFTKAGISISFD